jgi:opacity protein-like surface antigen
MEIEMKKLILAAVASALLASSAFARTAGEQDVAQAANPESVYSAGEYRGTDPDPQVRFDLRRESPHGGD